MDIKLTARFANLASVSMLNNIMILQFKYSPRNLDGFGLTDGEVVERLWAYLRRFARMTKEMRPSHRVDVMLYYTILDCPSSD